MAVFNMFSVICLAIWINPTSSMTWKLSPVPIPALQNKRSAFIGYYNKTVQILGGYTSENDLVEFPLDVTWNTATTTSITFGFQWSQSSIQIDAQLWMLPDNEQDLNVFDLNTKSIIKTVSFPGSAIWGRCVTSYNEYIFIIGGVDGLKDFHIYNRLTTNWSTGTSLNNKRYYHSCNVIDDTLYIIGGIYDNTVEYTNVTPLPNSIWTQITPYILSSRKCDHRSVIVSSLIYVIGGRGGKAVDQVDIIDTISKTISSPPTNKLVYGKESVSTIVVDRYIYVFGGYSIPETDNIHYQYASMLTHNPTKTYSPTKEPTHSSRVTNKPTDTITTVDDINVTNETKREIDLTIIFISAVVGVSCIIVIGILLLKCTKNKKVHDEIKVYIAVEPGTYKQTSVKIKPGLDDTCLQTSDRLPNLPIKANTLSLNVEGLQKYNV